MLKVKPEFLSKHGKRQFVVLTIEDFDRMKEALDDAQDAICVTPREATPASPTTLQPKSNGVLPTIPPETSATADAKLAHL